MANLFNGKEGSCAAQELAAFRHVVEQVIGPTFLFPVSMQETNIVMLAVKPGASATEDVLKLIGACALPGDV